LKKRLFLALLVSVSAAMSVNPRQVIAADRPVVAGLGTWTLNDLGYSDIYLPAGGGLPLSTPSKIPMRLADPVVGYTLPDGVSGQGPDLWYVLHFHFEVEFPPDVENGFVDILAQTNGPMPASLIEFVVSHPEGGGAPNIDWNSASEIEGARSGTTEEGRMEGVFTNYIPDAGVTAGTNALMFTVKEQNAQIEMLHVFADTSIDVVSLSPPHLSLNVDQDQQPAGPGERFEVPYTITNTGGFAARDVAISVTYPHDSLQLIGSDTASTSRIDGGASISGSFQFRALMSGSDELQLDLSGSTGGHVRETLVAAITSPSRVSKWLLGLLLGAVVIAAGTPVFPFKAVIGVMRDAFILSFDSREFD
jgi:hypothetical protein